MTTQETLSEAEKTALVPGITFIDGTMDRVPRIDGTGLEVWEVIDAYVRVGRNERRLRRYFHNWLATEQVSAALAYYRLFPEEVDRRLAEEIRIEEEFTRTGAVPSHYASARRK